MIDSLSFLVGRVSSERGLSYAVLLGSFLPLCIRSLPSLSVILLGAVCSLLVLLALYHQRFVIFLVCVALQYHWAMAWALWETRPLPVGELQRCRLTGTLLRCEEVPMRYPGASAAREHPELRHFTVSLRVQAIEDKPLRAWNQWVIQLFWKTTDPQQLQPLSCWEVVAIIKSQSSPANEGSFRLRRPRQTQRTCRGQVITAQQTALAPRSFLQALKTRIKRMISRYPHATLMENLLFGESLPPGNSVRSAIQKSGIAHLWGTSGLHLAVLGYLTKTLLRGIQVILPLRWIEPFLPMLGSSIVVLLYALLAGINPTSRRLLMTLALDRCRKIRLLSGNFSACMPTSLALLLLWDPLSVLSPSFWMSCQALLAIRLWDTFLKRSYFKSRFWDQLVQTLSLQTWLLVAMAPLQIVLFRGVSLAAMFTNLLAIPLMSWVTLPALWMGALGALLQDSSHFRPMGPTHLAFSMTAASLDLLTKIATLGQRAWLPCSAHWSIPALWAIACLLLQSQGLLKQSLYCSRAICLVLWLPIACRHAERRWWIDVLDVGQGLAVVIRSGGHAILYDTGASWPGGSMAEKVIIPYLQWHGLTLDAILISHGDNDHAGGLPALRAYFPEAWVGSGIQATDVKTLLAGQRWIWQQLQFEVLWPRVSVRRATNRDSCVIQIKARGIEVLLTGDLDAFGEQQLAQHTWPDPCTTETTTLLQVPHHGSNTSSCYALLKKIRPALAFVSVGLNNPWKLPAKAVLQRYASLGVPVYTTAELGQIKIEVSGQHCSLLGYGTHLHPRWYQRSRSLLAASSS